MRPTLQTLTQSPHPIAQVGALGLSLLLSACGGGAQDPSKLYGVVVDGYITGATVCLDLNSNNVCDANEPSATTDANGQYIIDPGKNSSAGLNLIALVPGSAKDADDGGQTLTQAGKTAYTMVGLVGSDNAITPISTLVVAQMKTANQSLAQAKQDVLSQLGLSSDTNLSQDPIAANNYTLQGAARLAAAKLQKAQANLPSSTKAEEKLNAIQTSLQTQQGSAGTLVSASSITTNKLDTKLSSTSSAQLLTYKMPSAKGELINATAMLFVPNTPAPSTGWPLVVFGHGTTGVARACAPSVTMAQSGTWDYAGLVQALLQNGVAVVAPDYEGMGPADIVPEGHPYLDLGSAGRAMALSALAAKNWASDPGNNTRLNGQWAALGHSQGGHASLAAAQFSGLASGMKYMGAVAIAPASGLVETANLTWAAIMQGFSQADTAGAIALVTQLNLYASYLVKGTQAGVTPISASTVLGDRMKTVFNNYVSSQCWSDYANSIVADFLAWNKANGTPTTYSGIDIAAVNSASVTRLINANEPGKVTLPGKTLIIQGESDTTVLPSVSQKLANGMKSLGSDTTYALIPGTAATHTGVLGTASAQLAIKTHLTSLFTSQ